MRVFREAGVDFLGGADTREDRIAQAREEIGLDAWAADHRSALEQDDYEAVVVATPPHVHTPIALEAARAGCHLFIEKPVAADEAGLDDLEAIVRANELVAHTAYCYRFIPSAERLRELVQSGRIGRILSARLEISSYLPDWHPWEDYRSFYMAKKEQGGGALLDESHGVDLLRWVLGDVASVSAFVGNVSDLEITSDDLAVLLLRFRSGPVVEAHFDLLGRSPRVGAEFIGSEGTILWDRIDPKISLYDAKTQEWETETFEADDTVQSYARQAKHFLECIAEGSTSRTPLADGRATLRVLLASFAAAESGARVDLARD
jgi:predicted dehydrogenase